MDDDRVINVNGVSKKFCRNLNRSMLYGVQDISRNLLGLSSNSEKLRKDEFWAVDNVSFEMRRGETLGIIGPNGSGKTTILKLLNGIFMPDKGRIEVKGKLGALIEIGAGFHPMLTGRENVYVNGAIMGMGKKEIDEKFDEIVEFADIGDFLDTPVKNYSSGMLVRLGFSVAVHTDPDILLVDEVLSVGDLGFRRKSVQRMRELIKDGRKSVIFVSHNMLAVRALCDRAIWLYNGEIRDEGTSKSVTSHYEKFADKMMTEGSLKKLKSLEPTHQSGLVKFTNVQFLNREGKETDTIEFMDYLRIRAWYYAKKSIQQPNFRFHFITEGGESLVTPSSLYQGNLLEYLEPGKGYVDCVIERLPIMPGNFSVCVSITSSDFLDMYTKTLYNKTFYVSNPTKKKVGVPCLLRGDCKVWIPCRIEYSKKNSR